MVMKVFDMPDNSKSAIVQGISRVKILDYLELDPYFVAAIEALEDDPVEDELALEALVSNLRKSFDELMHVAPALTEEHTGMLRNIQKPNRLTDRAISLINTSNHEKQGILEELNIKNRIEKSNNIKKYNWQKPHLSNQTGTNKSYHPNKKNDEVIKKYKSWKS